MPMPNFPPMAAAPYPPMPLGAVGPSAASSPLVQALLAQLSSGGGAGPLPTSPTGAGVGGIPIGLLLRLLAGGGGGGPPGGMPIGGPGGGMPIGGPAGGIPIGGGV